MPDSHEFITSVNQLLAKLNESGELNTGLEIANRIMILLGSTETEPVDNIVDEHVMQLPNAERYDHWFQNHPWMGGERAAFEVLDAKETPIQAKFYWLKKRSRQFIAGGVHFTENWEDAPYTRNDSFKIGIDFFLAPDGKSLLVTLSNKGNLRIVELQQKLNNTQVEIFSKWRDATQVASVEALHTTLWDSFMLQSVNKEFYKGVANSFTELLQHLKESGREEEASKLFASRLLGRLLFVWFLRKKHIIDESTGYFDTTGANSTNYYRNSLEILFFNTLNVPIDDRDEFKNENQKRLLEVEDNEPQTKIFQTDSNTPYLNGGLFEPHENDWYRDADLTFPEGYFTNLFEHFNQFNFTTDESTPEYEQVAIDPEMLGQVFESLLATQVDETGQQARKAKGAFYTPREIVGYMCKESLRNYLYSKAEDDERYTKSIDLLLDRSDHEWAGAGTNSKRDAVPKEYRSIIVDALDTVTVLDPACGSGAFPMGMLQLLIKTYERLEGRFDPYKTKLQIVQNNIFGVDIEPMAIEIARLRAWLSLVVDEEENQKVAPLPNLDFKFVCANSLIPLDKEQSIFADKELHQKLKDIRFKYFNARVPSSKKKLQAEYNKLADSSQQTLLDDLRTRQLKSFDPFRNSRPAEFFDTDQMFGIEKGFDLVIGNPPWVFSRKGNFSIEHKLIFAKYYIGAKGKINLFSIFLNKGLLMSVSSGLVTMIIPNTFLRGTVYEEFRKYLIGNARILKITDTGSDVFGDVTASTVVLIIQNSKPFDTIETYIFSKDRVETKTGEISTKEVVQSKSSILNVGVSDIANEIKGKVLSHSKPLSDYIEVLISGIQTWKQNKSNLISKERTSELHRPLIEGKDIDRFNVKFNNKYILYDKSVLNVMQDEKIFLRPEKIVIQRVSGGKLPVKAAIDRGQYYCFNSLNTLICKSVSNSFVTAILNSKLTNWYYSTFFSNNSSLTVNISAKLLKQVPIPTVEKSTQKEIEAIVEDIMIDRQDNSSKVLELEQKLDQIIYKLYELNPEEVKFIEEMVL